MPRLLVLVLAGCAPLAELPPLPPWDPGAWGDTATGPYGEYGEDPGEDTQETQTETEPTVPREILTVRDCSVTLRVRPTGGSSTFEVAGEFNGWTPAPLTDGEGDGIFEAELGVLEPGTYAYKLLEDGRWEGDPPLGVYSKWLDGAENRALRVGDCERPLLQVVRAAGLPEGRVTASVQVALAADEAPIDPASVRVTVGQREVVAAFDPGGLLEIDVTGLPPGKHSVRVWAADTAGRRAENEPLFLPLWVEAEPFGWEDAAMYFVFTDRFRNGDYGQPQPRPPVDGVALTANYQGGDFLGVVHALDEGYFEDLGINLLWMSPAYDNAEGGWMGADGVHQFTGYHGYWPIDPLALEHRWGDSEATAEDRMDELVQKAHTQGVRVLFDLVLNHVHEDHIYRSEHPEWFGPGCVCGAPGCEWDLKPVECWFTNYLPDLDYKNHAIVERVVADTLRLIERYDIDAVRIDAAKHMDHVIMRTLRMRLKEEIQAVGGAEVYLVGETFTGDHALIMDYVNDFELHAQFDFPIYFALRSTMAYGASFRELEATVSTGEAFWGDAAPLMSPFLGNHDVERFATSVTGLAGDPWSGALIDPMAEGGGLITRWDVINRASMGLAFVFTQPGVPLLYYGDEIGLHGGPDPDNRRMMSFEPYLSANQRELLARVQAVGQARADHPVLRRGDRRQLFVDDDFLAYARFSGPGDAAVIAMNKGSGQRRQVVDLSGLGLDGQTLTSVAGGDRQVTLSGSSAEIVLDPWEYVVLLP